MSKSFSLDDIRAAAEAKYGATEIEIGKGKVAKLINPLRLDKTKRDELFALVEDASDNKDIDGAFTRVIELSCETEAQAKALLAAAGGDVIILKEIVEKHIQGVQVGEA